MADWLSKIFGQKINGVRVTPLVLKIVTIFTVFLLISNFTTNYINLMLNRGEQMRLLNQLLVKDLKEMHVFARNQHEIFDFNPDMEATVRNIETAAARNHRGERVPLHRSTSRRDGVLPRVPAGATGAVSRR